MLNSFGQPIRMNVTPDGQYLFFPSAHETDRPKGEPIGSQVTRRWGDWDAYWVSTGFLDELESQVMTRRSAAEAIIREYRTQGLRAAVAKMETLLGEPSDSHYLELSELLVFCGELIGAGRLEEADELSVLRFITEEFPGSGGAWLDLARAYERRSEIESSRAACAEALELNPDDAEAATLLERLVRRKPAG
jgi:tetratricopeptide (TPR) repeat protein